MPLSKSVMGNCFVVIARWTFASISSASAQVSVLTSTDGLCLVSDGSSVASLGWLFESIELPDLPEVTDSAIVFPTDHGWRMP